MIANALLGLLTGLTLAAPAPPAESDQKKLQGEWNLESKVINGKPEPKKAALARLFVDGTKMTVREDNEVIEQLTFTLDPRAKPKAIDLKKTSRDGRKVEGKVIAGIYKLEGDTLTICVGEPGRKRPEDFSTERGGGHIMLVLKKVKR